MKAERLEQTFNGKVSWIVDGSYFKLLETVNEVTVELFRAGQRVMFAAGVEGGYYQRLAFDRVEITTGGNEAVAWLYAPDQGGSDRLSVGGSITVDQSQASLLANEATATVGVAAATVLAAAAGREFVRFRSRSTNTDAIAIGAASVTVNGAVVLNPGEEWEVPRSIAPCLFAAISGTASQSLDILSGA